MAAGMFGYAIGALLATGGAGYLLLGLLWALRIYKRWPRGSYVAASIFAIFLGVTTASVAGSTEQVVVTMAASLCAAAFLAWRGKLFSKRDLA